MHQLILISAILHHLKFFHGIRFGSYKMNRFWTSDQQWRNTKIFKQNLSNYYTFFKAFSLDECFALLCSYFLFPVLLYKDRFFFLSLVSNRVLTLYSSFSSCISVNSGKKMICYNANIFYIFKTNMFHIFSNNLSILNIFVFCFLTGKT